MTTPAMDVSQHFESEGYAVFKRALPEELRKFLSLNYQILHRNSYFKLNDGQVEKAYAAYGLPISDSLLEVFGPLISQSLGYEVYPAYTYTRFYLPGATLFRHLDRPSCEISGTLAIDYVGPSIWPIFIETKAGEALEVDLEPGDMLLYKGAERKHWREAFDGDWQIQVFLHFVRKGGPYEEFKYDKRPHLGAPVEQRQGMERRG